MDLLWYLGIVLVIDTLFLKFGVYERIAAYSMSKSAPLFIYKVIQCEFCSRFWLLLPSGFVFMVFSFSPDWLLFWAKALMYPMIGSSVLIRLEAAKRIGKTVCFDEN